MIIKEFGGTQNIQRRGKESAAGDPALGGYLTFRLIEGCNVSDGPTYAALGRFAELVIDGTMPANEYFKLFSEDAQLLEAWRGRDVLKRQLKSDRKEIRRIEREIDDLSAQVAPQSYDAQVASLSASLQRLSEAINGHQ